MKFKIKADFKEFVAVFLNYKLFKAINGKISPMQYHSITSNFIQIQFICRFVKFMTFYTLAK